MKVIVVGLGSMGKRRIRLINQLDKNIEIVGVDSKEERRRSMEEKEGILTYSRFQDVIESGAACAFICTSPLSHAELISFGLKQGLHIFSEINLVSDQYDDNIFLASENGLVLFLSSTFLYRKEIDYIRRKAENAKSKLSYSYHVGQYLPDWHPWENYTDYFIGDKRTNGCREIMAIEFPWLYKTFGEIIEVSVKKGKKSSLKTVYNDSYLLLLEHANGTQGMVSIDVISRKAVRNLEIFGEDLYLCWDGTANGLTNYNIEKQKEEEVHLYDSIDHQELYADFIVENAYLNEIRTFFAEIENKEKALYSFDEDKEILGIIDRIEG